MNPEWKWNEQIIEVNNLVLKLQYIWVDRPFGQFNVYRVFYVRDEGVLFDRLGLGVTSDKLSDIYLQNRKSLVFENCGGSCVLVEEAVINNVRSVNNHDEKKIARLNIK